MNQENKFNFSAVLWDFDGTIADTQTIHAKTEVDTLKKYGINISEEEITKRFSGVKLSIIFKTLFDENNIKTGYKESRELKWKTMIEIVKTQKITFMPGAKVLIETLFKNNVKMAIASSSIKSYLDLAIDSLGIRNKFEFVLSGDDVECGKPDPEIFIKAASILGVKNEACLVIEDGTAGVLAAQAANMKCIVVGNHFDKKVLTEKSIGVDTLEVVDFDFLSREINKLV